MLSLLGGYVASRMRGQSFWVCALGLAGTITLLLALGLGHYLLTVSDPALEVFDDRLVVNLYLLLMMPAWHSGAFIAGLAVVALAWVSGKSVSAVPLGGLLALTILAAASNTLVILYAAVPASLALADGMARRHIAMRQGLQSVVALVVGAVVGHVLGLLSGRRELPLPALASMPDNAVRAFAGLPGQPFMLLTLVFCVPVILAALFGRRSVPAAHHAAARYFALVGACACVAGILATLPLFISPTGMNWRYATPVAWWPLILAVGICGPWLSRWAAGIACGATIAAVGLVAASAMASGSLSPAIMQWRPQALACLDKADPDVGLRAGFASFWHGRTMAAASDWRRQIESSDFGEGRPILWTDDPRSWVRQRNGPTGTAPPFRFIVLWHHDPEALRRIHGAPTRIVPCGDTPIWIYPASWDPLDQLISMADPLVPQALAVGRRVCLPPKRSSADPRGLPLPPGRWRITLHYHLTAGAPVTWRVGTAAIALTPGDSVAGIVVDGPARVALDDLAGAPLGTELTVEGYSIVPSGLPTGPHTAASPPACRFDPQSRGG